MKFWSMISKSYAQDAALVGNSYPLLYAFPKMLYTSKRPKTDMSMFQTPLSHTYVHVEQIPRNRITVARYAKGMSKGLFYEDRPEEVCGYFYYHEPESTTFLQFDTSLRAFNKIEACRKLIPYLDIDTVEKIETLIKLILQDKELDAYMQGVYPLDMRFTPRDTYQPE